MPLRAVRRYKDISRTLTVLAVAVALAVTVSIPAIYFGIAYVADETALRTEAEINARLVERLINASPEMWKYEELRMEELLSQRPDRKVPETRSIIDAEGTVVARRSDRLDSPVMTASHVLFDSGRPAGRLEIARSLRPVMFRTALAALFGFSLGFAVFFTLRLLPMSALRGALASLSREKERAQVTLQAIREGVVMADRDGNVVLLNSAAERMTGWPQADALGRRVDEVVRLAGPASGGGGNGSPGPGTEGRAGAPVLVSRDGTERLVEESAAPIVEGDGRFAGAVHVIRDVTEKVRLDEELLKSRKLESLGVLAGGIAHDFNNVLTGILGNISLAKLDASPGDRLYRRLEEAEKASDRARALASRLLTFAQGGRPVRTLIALEKILRSAAVSAIRGTDVRCAFRIPDGLWPTEADAGQIGQVVYNLVINAVQAMPQGGEVTVGAVNAAVGKGETLNVAPGDYVRVDVEDTGVGIPREDRERIFDPFFTTNPKGNGLGLTSCFHIMRNHGGSILVESEPGLRTVFRVYLPASKSGARRESSGETEMSSTGGGRILVMDDEDLVLDVAAGMLGHLGYETAVAKDGAEAVAMYARAAESGEPFDAVILDLRVHGGMGGREAIGKLREVDAGVRAVVSSGYSSDPVMADHRAYGFAGVVAKPYRIEDLRKVLDEVVRGAPGPA